VITTPCGHVQDRDLNAALNLARIAHRHAQAQGISSYVARTGRFTPTARGGQLSLVGHDQHSPVKREASSDASQRGDAPALAAQAGGLSARQEARGGTGQLRPPI
jgi:hypothetical protein